MADDHLHRITREILLTSFFGRASGFDEPWILDRLAESVDEQEVSAGEVLFREGETAQHLYFMNEGRVRMRATGHPDWVYEGRWVIGTTDMVAARRRARTATAEATTRLFRIPGNLWLDLMEDSFEAAVGALVGSARGTLALHTQIVPDGGFEQPRTSHLAVGDDALSSVVDRTLMLLDVPLFRGAGVQPLTDLARHSQIHALPAGEALFGAGAPPRRTHVVVSGEVEASRRAPDLSARFGPGAVVGGAACLGDPEGQWSASATVDSLVLSFSNEDWFNEMEEHVDLVLAAMSALALERERLFDRLALPKGEIVLR